ncbi:MAG: bifunctional riboflavin kinase/FAD synthetase [Bacteroidales bacterium]|nr:bifunctional riboflavin kinase/FAD synthetase [Bacteroidales bacterium]
MQKLDYSKLYNFKNTVITVGAFDGVHLGHQQILTKLITKAREIGGNSLVISFWPHPRHLLHKDSPMKLLSTRIEKEKLLATLGVDLFIEIPFTSEFSQFDARTFIKDYLIGLYKMKYFMLGYNHHFGRDRLGNLETIKKYAEEFNFEVDQVGPCDIGGEKISSSKIRNLLNEGKVSLACQFLGYYYTLSGVVVKGQRLGRTIGFPTANIFVDDEHKLIPKDGVYAVKVKVENNYYQGMLNIGNRPTVNKNPDDKTIEVNIFGFNEDIYAKNVTLFFIERIRDEVKFTGIENLKNQLEVDKGKSIELLKKPPENKI